MFVGDERVTEATLDGYVDGEISSYLDQGATLADVSYGDSRHQAAFIVLIAELGRQIGLEAPETKGAANEYEAQYLEAVEYYEVLSSQAEPREMTEAESEALDTAIQSDQSLLQRIGQEWVTEQGFDEDELAQFNMDVQANPDLITEMVQEWGAQQAGFADDLNGYIEEYDIAVNPRYGSLDISPVAGVFEVEVPQR
jgi:hypothetical protein